MPSGADRCTGMDGPRRSLPAIARGYGPRTMPALHELTAHELVAAYAHARAVAGRGRARGARADRRLGAEDQRDVPRRARRARSSRRAPPRRAGARGSRGRALDGVPITIKENIYTRGDPAPIGTRANHDAPPQPADAPAAARRPRGRLRAARQDHDARLRHAVLGPVEPARRDAQPVAPGSQPVGLELGRRRRPPSPATPRSTSAPTSAARSACRRRTAASSRSSHRSAASRSIRRTWAASPGR